VLCGACTSCEKASNRSDGSAAQTSAKQSKDSEHIALLRACLELGNTAQELQGNVLSVFETEYKIQKLLDSDKNSARQRAEEATPAVRAALTAIQKLQAKFEAKPFNKSLPAPGPEVFEAYSISQAHYAEIGSTRALAILALAERGEAEALYAMRKFTTTTGQQVEEARKPIDEAFSQLCYAK